MPYPLSPLPSPPPYTHTQCTCIVGFWEILVLLVPNLLTDATWRLITYPKTFTLKGYYNNGYKYMYPDAQQRDVSSRCRQPTV